MKTIESFPYVIDNIFSELERDSQIRIDCRAEGVPSQGNNCLSIRVAAVNGMASSWRFHHRIKHLKAEVLVKLREVIPQIAPGDLDAFIDMALRRVRRIARTVLVTGFGSREERNMQSVCWSPRQLRCFLGDTESSEPGLIGEALIQTRRQAWLYYAELKRLEERIGCLAGYAICLSDATSAEKNAGNEGKIRLTCTVAFFCAVIRVAYDRNLIEVRNVSELCRQISRNFCTARQENLSAHSIRNHFDNPSPEVLEEVMNEFRVDEKFIAKFIQRQRA